VSDEIISLAESNNVLRAEMERLEAELERVAGPMRLRIVRIRELLGLEDGRSPMSPPTKRAKAIPAAKEPAKPRYMNSTRGDKRELVCKLALAGKDLDAIAAAVGISCHCVRMHILALKRQGRLDRTTPNPTRHPAVSREEQVFALVKQGKKPKEIAEAIDMSLSAVSFHTSTLRKKGRLPPVVRESTAPAAPALVARNAAVPAKPEAREEEQPAAEPMAASEAVEELPVSTREALRAEAARQCRANGAPAGPALFMTTLAGKKKHAHRGKVNRMGDGVTEPDESGHQHRVYRFEVQPVDVGDSSHQHFLVLP
jgi:DNA-binding CsgD family transcriptional regulator